MFVDKKPWVALHPSITPLFTLVGVTIASPCCQRVGLQSSQKILSLTCNNQVSCMSSSWAVSDSSSALFLPFASLNSLCSLSLCSLAAALQINVILTGKLSSCCCICLLHTRLGRVVHKLINLHLLHTVKPSIWSRLNSDSSHFAHFSFSF